MSMHHRRPQVQVYIYSIAPHALLHDHHIQVTQGLKLIGIGAFDIAGGIRGKLRLL